MKKTLLSFACLSAILFADKLSAQLSFNSVTSYSTGLSSHSVASADFDGDGKPDLAVANSGSNDVSILLGSGTGTFATAINYTVGTSPSSLTSADFNGDGIVDLALANSGSNDVTILLGSGTGAFFAAANYSVGTTPLSITSADFNGDGKVDLATVNYNSGDVSILLGSGTGTFTAAVSYGGGSVPRLAVSGDFNMDGKIDLAVANGVGVSILLGSGTGTFATAVSYPTAGSSRSIVSADFNGDGKLDLATANYSSANVSILLGSGTGAFGTPVNYAAGTYPTSIISADFDGDGKLDLATANYGSGNTSVLLGSGAGTFTTAVNYMTGTLPMAIISVDFNGDGKPDLAVANGGGNKASILLNTSIPPAAALSFDGINDIVQMPASSVLNDFGLGAFTLESWVYPNSLSAANSIIRKTGDYNLYITNDGSLVAEVWYAGTSDGNFAVINTQTAINLNAWSHVAFVWNGSSGSFYLNGVLVSTNTSLNYYSGSENLALGASSLFGNNLDGLLDEVRIWNRALCQSEIQNNMSGEIANTSSGLMANYHFNQGYDTASNTLITLLVDASGNVNNGTLTNFALVGPSSNWVSPGAVTSGSVVTAFMKPTVTVSGVNTLCNGSPTTLVANGNVLTFAWMSGPNTSSYVVTPTVTTSYSVIGTNSLGCVSDMAIKTITVNALPTLSVTSGVICAGQSFTIVPSGALTYTYSSGTDVVMPTSDATYSVSGTDANGCVSSTGAVSSVIVNALPNIIATTNNTLLCSGQTATLSVTGASTYTWSTSENTSAIAVTPTTQTTYTVDGTDANGCSNTTTIMQDVSLCTGVIGQSGVDVSFISVYPNPNNGLFNIELTTASQVTLINALGEVIIAETMVAGKHNLNIQNQSSGVYFVKIIQQDKQHIIKLIKE